MDVAAASGVSQATVARVFSSPDLVSPATAEKVREVADRLGYVPNAIARSLKSQRTDMVGAVVPARGGYWQGVIGAFSRQLTDRGLQLLLFSFSDAHPLDRVLTSVDQYRLDGLVLASAIIGPSQLARMAAGPAPVVAFNQPSAAGVTPSVSVDNEAGTGDLARHLHELGCQRVCFIGGLASASTDSQRHRGAAGVLAGLGVECVYVEAGDFSYDAGYRAAQAMVREGTVPDAAMAAADELAFGVIDGFEAAGVRVPDDVLVTGFDGVPQSNWARYDLTTVVQPIDVLVDRAISLLIDQPPTSGDVPDVIVAGDVRRGRTTRRSTSVV
ncbi:MAG: LacI family DNA-binding transcriptional regulator [Actinomycetota bacterium]